MQFRHLRYFVKIVEAGSFSRAAAAIHVAQPALSQQIADLEERMGVPLLQRSPRGIRPTAAGEILYREASSILTDLEKLPGLLAPSPDGVAGKVAIGFAVSLAMSMSGPFLEFCRAKYPKVTLKFADNDSESLEAQIAAKNLDLAVVFEDELVPTFERVPLYRQKMFFVSSAGFSDYSASVSLQQIEPFALVLPSLPNARRRVIDRVFAEANLSPNIIAETDTLSSEISAVRTNLAHSILNMGAMGQRGFSDPLAIDPPIYMTCSVITSSDFPLTHAGEAVRNIVIEFVRDWIKIKDRPGAEWIGPPAA